MAKRSADAAPAAPDAKKPKTEGKDAEPKLTPEMELQRGLLNSDPALQALFLATVVNNRPPDLSMKTMAKQFWASRQHLLRAFERSQQQQRGPHNTLAQKVTSHREGVSVITMNSQQISDIFAQHPIVRRAFDELVPAKIASPSLFWSRFFASRLCKRLKGQRIMERDDHKDADIDRYLEVLAQQETQASPEANGDAALPTALDEEHHVPHFLDLEGNEQHHSQRKGNNPLYSENISADPGNVLRTINAMSEKLLRTAAPADTQRRELHAPAGMDEQTYNQLRLRDLADHVDDDRVKLSISDARTLHAGQTRDSKHASKDAERARQQDPAAIQSAMLASTKALSLPLDKAIGFDAAEDPDAAAAEPKKKRTPMASRQALAAANAQLTSLLTSQSHVHAPASTPLLAQLPDSIAENARLVHYTTREYLRFFYGLFLPLQAAGAASLKDGLPREARDLPGLVQSLGNSEARIAAVASEAETARKKKLDAERARVAEIVRKSEGRRKPRIDEQRVGPGERELRGLMGPMVRAMQTARDKWALLQRAL